MEETFNTGGAGGDGNMIECVYLTPQERMGLYMGLAPANLLLPVARTLFTTLV